MTAAVHSSFQPSVAAGPAPSKVSALDSLKLAQGAANYPAAVDPISGALTPVYKPEANQVTIGGVTIKKYPNQSDLSSSRTGDAYPRAAMAKLNPTVYVVDDYVHGVIPVGSGAQRVVVTHGDQSKAIVQLGLPGAKVVRVDATGSNGNLTTGGRAAGIRRVIGLEAKIQNTPTPDLSRVFVSMSLGDSRLTSTLDEDTRSAIAAFTKLGGTFFGSAGNGHVNSTTVSQGIGIVYASQAVVGSALGSNPRPADSLASGVFSVGNGSISRVSSNRLASSSTTYVGAGTVFQRFNPGTQSVEFQDSSGSWRPAIPANRVGPAPVPNANALDNTKAGHELTASEAQGFDAWQLARENAALAAHKMPTNSKVPAELSDLTPIEAKALSTAARAEFLKRFGTDAVMSVAAYKVLVNARPGFDKATMIDRSLPSNMTAANTFVSAETSMLFYQAPQKGELQFYAKDTGGVLRSKAAFTIAAVSTSAATPDIVVRAVQDRAIRLERAQGSR
jgi:hypothetical protein